MNLAITYIQDGAPLTAVDLLTRAIVWPKDKLKGRYIPWRLGKPVVCQIPRLNAGKPGPKFWMESKTKRRATNETHKRPLENNGRWYFLVLGGMAKWFPIAGARGAFSMLNGIKKKDTLTLVNRRRSRSFGCAGKDLVFINPNDESVIIRRAYNMAESAIIKQGNFNISDVLTK